MTRALFDDRLRAMRRDRAFRIGPELFLFERAFADILDRLAVVNRRFESALLIGSPDPEWSARLTPVADAVTVIDPGPLFAAAAGGSAQREHQLAFQASSFDLCLAIGTLDTVDDLPAALLAIRAALSDDSLLMGVVPGGETLPRLRAAMRAADEVAGGAVPHVHPRIEPSALAMLLTAAGFQSPVVDVDRIDVTYPAMAKLIADLRAMAATNILAERPRRPLSRAAIAAATGQFEAAAPGHRPSERFELLHFAAWTP